MAINFPSSPATGQSYTDTTTGQTWIFNGVGWASSYNRSSVVRQSFTASAGQTTFTVSGGYAPGLLDVYQNGVKLVSGSDYTATNGTTVILVAAAAAGDSVEVWGIANFTVANMPTLAQLYAEVGDAGATVMRNRIINGAMNTDQRNGGAAINAAASNAFAVDRWVYFATQSGKVNLQQNAGSVTPPAGFSTYLGVTSTAATTVAASDYYVIAQRIEGPNFVDFAWGSASAQSVTLSFWVRSSLTGTFGGAVNNTGYTRSYPFTYTINNANTWEYKTVTIPGDTTGSWPTNTLSYLAVTFGLGVGSTTSGTANTWAGSTLNAPTGATSVVGTNGATFYLTGVQLELGGTATVFERRNYQQELAMCQRYYQEFGHIIDFYGNYGGYSPFQTRGYLVTMRATPTLSYTTGSSAGGGSTVNMGTSGGPNGFTSYISGTPSAGASNTWSGTVKVSAEL